MLQSKLFYKTKKDVPTDIKSRSAQLLYQGDFVDKLASGIYSFLPLGWRVHRNIEKIIREEMKKIGAQEIFLPTLQPKKMWERSGRWEGMGATLFKLEDRHNRKYALGPTHEEVITKLIAERVFSYRDLPQALFQIQNKFRNEVRATGGLLRTREFVMKDLYSFHKSKQGLDDYYKQVEESYPRIYNRCGLEVIEVEAVTGDIGGSQSHEFMALSASGEDEVLVCPDCNYGRNIELGEEDRCPQCGQKLLSKQTIECGHIFKLGKKYSEKFNAYYVDAHGQKNPIYAGCYGIGLGRLMAAIVEVSNDKKGIIWPKEVAPFAVHLIEIPAGHVGAGSIKKTAQQLYKHLKDADIEVLYDDREDASGGEKLVEADLLGIPLRVVVSPDTLKQNSVEVKRRDEDEVKLVRLEEVVELLRSEI